MLLLIVSYIKAPAQVEPHIKSHGEWVAHHLEEGNFLFAGPKKSGPGGVIGAKSIDKPALLQILAEDSYVKADVAEYQIVDVDLKAAAASFEALKGV
ncbi:YciI family protein [Variovorax sp. RB2P76]|uniref:YciI family protein n=1 Tax=Variovorax sp. RB2P76 TaxID=3443736 RepID=UPI003F4715BE